MGKPRKILEKVLDGLADRNISFRDLRGLLKSLGFDERIKGDHYIFTREDVAEVLNLQPKGSKAKAYQVKQVREIILEYRFGELEDE
jgi:virulence-associated protein VapD